MKLYLDPEHLTRVAAENAARYAAADPFPHAVLDGVLPDEALDFALDHFPPLRSQKWQTVETDYEVKLGARGEDRLPAELSLLLYQFNSAPFLAFLEGLTGIDNLLPDPYFVGSGLHQAERGGRLDVHTDWKVHNKLRFHRRLNVLIYLNRCWSEE